MNRHPCLAAALALGIVGTCHADIYKCRDADGHVTYTNQKSSSKGCELLSKDQAVSTVSAPRPAAPAAKPGRAAPETAGSSSAGFPKVDSGTQRRRDDDRRGILEQELSTENKNLEQAKKELSEQEALRGGDERNYQKVLDRLQTYKDKVSLHERNIEALKKEIGNLR